MRTLEMLLTEERVTAQQCYAKLVKLCKVENSIQEHAVLDEWEKYFRSRMDNPFAKAYLDVSAARRRELNAQVVRIFDTLRQAGVIQ